MIRIHRIAEPTALTKHKVKWTKAYREARVEYRVNPSPDNKRKVENAENKYGHDDVKVALTDMCDGKCAYCESDIPHIDYPHIEHFRPKTRYPKLCFEWKNLLLACGRCNGAEFKGINFPLACDSGPFVNPCEEDPIVFFDFEFDPQTGTANVIPKNQRGMTTEVMLGLNRPELVKHRSSVVKMFIFVAIRAKNGDPEALTRLKECMGKEQEYAAFARALHQKFNLP